MISLFQIIVFRVHKYISDSINPISKLSADRFPTLLTAKKYQILSKFTLITYQNSGNEW